MTLRDLDTMKQVRMPIADLSSTISKLSYGLKSWEEVCKEYPLFVSTAKDQE